MGRSVTKPRLTLRCGIDRLLGFKKNVNRATTQVMMKTGQYSFPGGNKDRSIV